MCKRRLHQNSIANLNSVPPENSPATCCSASQQPQVWSLCPRLELGFVAERHLLREEHRRQQLIPELVLKGPDLGAWRLEAIATRLEAIASRLEAVAKGLEAITLNPSLKRLLA